ncbi:MAG: AfsR/SARP family transcriptional regulator, partial [Hamadaea sp.]|nr:AfsR/SARP family transcriptional regulator [Hamadaea sp.]
VLGDAERADSSRGAVMDLYGYLSEDLDEARAYRTEALRAVMEYQHPPAVAEVLVGIADLALRRGQYEQAARLLAASERVRGTPDRSHPDVSRIAGETRNRLGENAFTEATDDGRRQDWHELAEITLAS